MERTWEGRGKRGGEREAVGFFFAGSGGGRCVDEKHGGGMEYSRLEAGIVFYSFPVVGLWGGQRPVLVPIARENCVLGLERGGVRVWWVSK